MVENGLPRPRGVLDVVTDGVAADLAGSVRDCCDCGAKFTGPGPRCPVCVQEGDSLNLDATLREARMMIGEAQRQNGQGHTAECGVALDELARLIEVAINAAKAVRP